MSLDTNHEPKQHKTDESIKSTSCTRIKSPPPTVETNSGDYRIYPSKSRQGDKSIFLYRTDGEKIPPNHQHYLEQFAYHPHTWVASAVPADESRYVIGLLDDAVETGSYVAIVREIQEAL